MNCKNCFKYGHTFYNCKKPIRSYGIILYRNEPTTNLSSSRWALPAAAADTEAPPFAAAVPVLSTHNHNHTTQPHLSSMGDEPSSTGSTHKKYLMICRKHTFGFTSLIRGKYSSSNVAQVQTYVDSMTNREKQMILEKPFGELWEYLWCGILNSRKNHDRTHAEFKFNASRESIFASIAASPTHWEEPEWEFPKGRMQQGETDIECALREFEEETHISKHTIGVIYNLCPFDEIYRGSNDKMYQITYFLAQLKHEEPNLLSFQEEEVSRMDWKDVSECVAAIRPENQEKKDLVVSLEDILNRYDVV